VLGIGLRRLLSWMGVRDVSTFKFVEWALGDTYDLVSRLTKREELVDWGITTVL